MTTAETAEEARAAWRALPADVAVLILTPRAAGWLGDPRGHSPPPRRAGRGDAGMTGQDTGIAGGEQAAALAPVRAYLLAGARAEADRILGQARSQADQTLRQARRDAEQAVRQARAEGEAEAAPAAAAERARGRERARSIVLGAQRQAYEDLRAQVLAAAGGCGTNRATSGWSAGLSALAAGAAGPGATVTAAPGRRRGGAVRSRRRGLLAAQAREPGRRRAGRRGA